MRGLAVIAAAAAGWILVAGVPSSFTRLEVQLPAFRDLVAAAVAFFVSGAVMLGILGVPSVAFAIGLLAAVAPVTFGARRRQVALSAMRDRWPDVLTYTRTAISAGATLEDATLDAMSKVGGEYDDLAVATRAELVFGSGFSAALHRIRSQYDDPTTDRVVATLAAASRSGGTRVGQSISVLARSIADEIRLRKAHDAALTEQRWTVNVALIAPWVLLCLAIATNPQAKTSFNTAEGTLVVTIGFIATVSGWLIARRTARLSKAPKVFR